MLNDFISVILDLKGNISSKRFNKSYFIKQNKEYLWEWFESQKLNFNDYSNREVIILLQNGYNQPPKCIVCDNDAKVQTYTSNYTFEYCSKECSFKSKNRAEKISKSKKTISSEQKQRIEKMRKQTNLEKYGVEYQSQRKEIKEIVSNKLTKRYLDDDVISKLESFEWLNLEYIIKKRSASDIADELKVYYGTVIEYLKKFNFEIRQISNSSKEETQIEQFLLEYNIDFTKNDRSVISYIDDKNILRKKELDFYIKDFNFAIELNGLYSHSYNYKESKKQKEKHQFKYNLCKEKNIHLLQITDQQWNQKQNIIKSIILNKCHKSNKIYARKCVIKEIDHYQAEEFFENVHIQGHCNTKNYYGLFFENELVFCVSIGNPRYNKNYDWEIIRIASKLNHSIVGGFSKVLSYIKKIHSGSIISYADKFYSNGNCYFKVGFRLISETKIGYFYTDKRNTFSRLQFQKHKLKDKLKFYDASLSESQNMFNNGFRRFWDCGQLVFVME